KEAKKHPRGRLRSLIVDAGNREQAGEYAQTVEAWQRILAAPDLRDLRIEDRVGIPHRASDPATSAIVKLRAGRGEKVYTAQAREAQRLWEGATEGERDALADQLYARFPAAPATRTALQHRIQARQRAKSPGAVAHACRRLLALGVTGKNQALAL